MQATVRSFEALGNIFGFKSDDEDSKISSTTKQPKVFKKKKVVKKTKTVVKSAGSRVLKTYQGVVIKVPGKSTTMKHESVKAGISEHWQSRNGLGSSVFLYMNFFNVTQANFATKIVATVTVKKEVDSEGVEITVLDIKHTPKQDCKFTFHIPVDGSGEFKIDSRIVNRINFAPRKNNLIRK